MELKEAKVEVTHYRLVEKRVVNLLPSRNTLAVDVYDTICSVNLLLGLAFDRQPYF